MKRTSVVTVRPRTPADDRFIVSLARPSFGRYSTTPEQGIAAMMNARSAVTLVAEAGGRPIGFAIVSFEALPRAYGPWTRPVLASLDAIAVHEGAQRTGVGRALLAEVERAARVREAVSIHLRTAISNGPAQTLFRRAGYQTAVQIQSFYRGGQGALAMMKLLAR
jgi:ribosomal protein S18 acetylase RimI-like enzyme